jgi:hypothetical protein
VRRPLALAAPSDTANGPALREVEAGVLPGGRYIRSSFTPRITFAVADQEWTAVQVLNGFFDIQQDQGTPDVIALQFTTTDMVFGANADLVGVTTSAGAVNVLQENPTLKVVEASPVTIDGFDGQRITVDTAGAEAGELLHAPPGLLTQDPGRRMRLMLFDTPEGVLGILLGGSVAKWSKAEAAAQPVLDSITISP